MLISETEFKKLKEEIRKEFSEIKNLLYGKGILNNWVKQNIACAMLNVKPRQLQNIRIHFDKNKNKVGSIRWRKGRGRTIEYHKSDIENYLNSVTVS